MPKTREAPFADAPNPGNRFWSLSWFEWLRDLARRINERPEISGTITPGNVVSVDSDNNLVDGGVVPTVLTTDQIAGILTSTFATKDYASETFITECPLDEAGTHGLPGVNTQTFVTQIQVGGGGAIGFQYKTTTIEIRDGWIDSLGTESAWVDV